MRTSTVIFVRAQLSTCLEQKSVTPLRRLTIIVVVIKLMSWLPDLFSFIVIKLFLQLPRQYCQVTINKKQIETTAVSSQDNCTCSRERCWLTKAQLISWSSIVSKSCYNQALQQHNSTARCYDATAPTSNKHFNSYYDCFPQGCNHQHCPRKSDFKS
jgi:hypothetical protein